MNTIVWFLAAATVFILTPLLTQGAAAGEVVVDYEHAILPRPRSVSASRQLVSIDGPANVAKRSASSIVDYAAEELRRDLAERVGLDATIAASPRATLLIELTQKPSQPEGYTVTSRRSASQLVYTVAGHDPNGILYGALAVGGAIEAATAAAGHPAAPAELTISDGPTMVTRLLPTQFYGFGLDDPKREQKLAILDWAARWRINAIWRGLDASEHELSAIAQETQRRGITLFGVVGFLGLRNAVKGAKVLGPCPLDPNALACVRSRFEKGARAKCGGFAFLFDDLSQEMYLHHTHCSRCKSRFRSTSEWQLVFIKEAMDVARAGGVAKFVVCPTPYAQGSAERFPDQKYFETLCSPEFMKDVLVFHCDFYTENIRKLKRRGLRNYIWWNNGLWTTTHYFDGIYMGVPRIFHIWYGYKSSLTTIPEPKPEALESLKRLGEIARHVYPAPTGSFAGKALGGCLGWNPRWTVEHEAAIRRRIVAMLFGRAAWGPYGEWESNLLGWYGEARTHSISFDKTEALTHIEASEKALAKLDAAWKAGQGIDAPLRCTKWHAAQLLPMMRHSITQARDSLKVPEIPPPVAVPEDDQVTAPEDVLLWLRFSREYEGAFADYTPRKLRARFHGSGPKLKRGVFGNALFMDGKQNCLEIPGAAASHLNPGPGSFTVGCWVFMMGHGWNQFVGKRGTNREIYRSIGYSIGSDRVGNRWRFTLEDDARHCVSVTAPMKKPLHHWHQLVGVRDATAREVRLYVDGQLAKSEPDSTGPIANTHPMRLGWDCVAGFRFWGFLDEVRVWNRALTNEEIRRSYEAGRRAVTDRK